MWWGPAEAGCFVMSQVWAPVGGDTEGGPVEPAQEDAFVRGVSQVIGGPLGEHAVRRRRRVEVLWTPARIVIVLALLTFTLHWVQKAPCQDGAWADFEQY